MGRGPRSKGGPQGLLNNPYFKAKNVLLLFQIHDKEAQYHADVKQEEQAKVELF